MTISDLRNDTIREFLRAVKCRVCGRRVQFTVGESAFGDRIVFARCHGSTEKFDFREEALGDALYDSHDPARDLVVMLLDWATKSLFEADCLPDVMELLKMNREGRRLNG
jgi:hypothetical protein